jgi:hypothetical protein
MAVKQTPEAWRRFVTFARERLSREDRAAELLTQAQTDQRPETIEVLAEEITRIRHEDLVFDGDLRRAWAAVTVAPVQNPSNHATNIVTGSVGGHLVQAGEIFGGVSFGPVDRSATPPAGGSPP